MWYRRETKLPDGITRQQFNGISADIIAKSVLDYYGITIADIRRRDRRAGIVVPRHLMHYFLSLLDVSIAKVTQYTSYDHACIIHGRNNIENWIYIDRHFRSTVVQIANLIFDNHKSQQNEKSTDYRQDQRA